MNSHSSDILGKDRIAAMYTDIKGSYRHFTAQGYKKLNHLVRTICGSSAEGSQEEQEFFLLLQRWIRTIRRQMVPEIFEDTIPDEHALHDAEIGAFDSCMKILRSIKNKTATAYDWSDFSMRFRTTLRAKYNKIKKNAQRTVSLHTRVPRSHLQELLGEYDPEEHDARYGHASPGLFETLPAENAPDPVAEAEQEELLADIRRLLGSVFASDEQVARVAEGLFVLGETPEEVAQAVLKTQYGVQLLSSRIIRELRDPANSGKIVGHLD